MEKDFPSIHTLIPENINENGATFNARIEKNESTEILKTGFIWSLANHSSGSKDTVFVEASNNDIYSATIDYALPANKEISFCGYLKTAEYEVFGDVKTFVSVGCNPPEITDYFPKHGMDGDTITIEGDNFTSNKSNYQISFGEYNGKIISASKNNIVITVPNNYETPGQSAITLKIFDDDYNIGYFDLDSLKIISINSSSFNIAESVMEINLNSKILNINNFLIGSLNIDKNEMLVSGNTISVNVPPNTASGQQEISATINNKKVTYKEKILFNSPWTEKNSCPEDLAYGIVPNGFAYDGNIIYNVPLGTTTSVRGGNNVFWEYSPETDKWDLIYEMEAVLKTNIFSFSLNENYYWGRGSNYLTNLSLYKYTYNKNQKILDIQNYFYDSKDFLFPFSIGVNGQGFIFGGFMSTIYPELPLFKYSETDNLWKKLESFDNAFDYKYWYGMTGFEINGKIYIGTGATNNDLTKEFWCYDPDNDSWTQLPDFPSKARCFSVGFSINGKGYIGLGSTEDWYIKTSNSLNDIWEFDPDDNSWKEVANFPGGGRSGAASVILNNKAYICFGNLKNDLWEFEPFSD